MHMMCCEFQPCTRTGEPCRLHLRSALLYGPQREVTGIVAVIRDETTRYAEERNLRKRLAELEGPAALDPSRGGDGKG